MNYSVFDFPNDIIPIILQHFDDTLLAQFVLGFVKTEGQLRRSHNISQESELIKNKFILVLSSKLFWQLRIENLVKKNISNSLVAKYNTRIWKETYYTVKNSLITSDPLVYVSTKGSVCSLEILLMVFDPTGNFDIFEKAALNQNMHKIIQVIQRDGRLCPSIRNNTALTSAIKYDRLKAVKLLLTNNNINPADRDNEAIIIASRGNLTRQIIIELENDPVNNNIPNHSPYSVLDLMFRSANYYGMRQGINMGNENIYDGVANNKINSDEIFELLLNNPKVNPSARDNEVLVNAVKYNQLNCVKVLLSLKSERGVNPNCRNGFPIIYAAENGFLDIVRLLLSDPRVDPSIRNSKVLIKCLDTDRLIREQCIYEHSIQKIKFFNSEKESNIRTEKQIKRNVLKTAAKIAKYLLKDLREQSSFERNSLESSKRINPAAKNNRAFLNAVCSKNYKVVELLLKDERVNPLDNDKEALLCCKSPKIMKLLLDDYRIDPCFDNNSLLSNSAKLGYWKVINVLLNDPRINPIDIKVDLNNDLNDTPWYIKILINTPKEKIIETLRNKKQEIDEEKRLRLIPIMNSLKDIEFMIR